MRARALAASGVAWAEGFGRFSRRKKKKLVMSKAKLHLPTTRSAKAVDIDGDGGRPPAKALSSTKRLATWRRCATSAGSSRNSVVSGGGGGCLG